MKTKEQVLQHLTEVGYTKKAINRIIGFLIGKDLKAMDEQITYKKGEMSFENFMLWFDCNCENIKVKKTKKTKLEAYKEIVDFLMSNVKDVPLYWLEYLNNDIKMLDIISHSYHTKLNKEYLNELDKLTEKTASELMDLFKGLEILCRK